MSFFSKNTRVLMADGHYRNISQLESGDMVLDGNLKPVRVNKISSTIIPLLELRVRGWYCPVYCSADTKVQTAGGIRNVAQLTINEKLVSKDYMPSTEELFEPSYSIGYIIGLYVGYGFINDTLNFHFGPNDELVEETQKLLLDIFNAKSTITKDVGCYKVVTDNQGLIDFFSAFGSRIERKVPKKYWSTNGNYLQGIYDGLVDYDAEAKVCRYIPITEDMAEFFSRICSILGIKLFANNFSPSLHMYPLYIKDETPIHDNLIDVIFKDDYKADWGWELELDTGDSFIVSGGLIVK